MGFLLRRSHVLVIAVHLVLDTEAAFGPAFVTLRLPLPTNVAGLDQNVKRGLCGVRRTSLPEWPDCPFSIFA